MRKLILIFMLAVSSSALADELSAGDLYSFCKASDEMTKAACRFYILGAVQGISLGSGSIVDSSGHFVPKSRTHFCIPDDLPQSQMVAVFEKGMSRISKAYPQDLKLPAISVLGAAMARAFPCSKF